MLARVPLALAPCVLCLGVFALGVVLAVAGVAAALLSDPVRLLVRLSPDHMSCVCGCVPTIILVEALGGEFDRANDPTGLVETGSQATHQMENVLMMQISSPHV